MDFDNSLKAFESATLCLNKKIRSNISLIPENIKMIAQEIRIRINKSIAIVCPDKTYFLDYSGKLLECESSLTSSNNDIEEIIKTICNYSIYSFQNQIKNGFITLYGGHRAGICGTAVIEKNNITNIKDISSINIRIAKQIKGCSRNILSRIGTAPKGTLIAGPPCCGKTTILRDIARTLSLNANSRKKITIIDERGEIAAIYKGIPQCDVGLCDILNGYPKGIGIIQAIKVLSPDIIICDEIGSSSEVKSIKEGINSGVTIIASIHAGSIDELILKKQYKSLLKTNAFKNIILLNNLSKHSGEFNLYNMEDVYVKNCRNNNLDTNRMHGRLLCQS